MAADNKRLRFSGSIAFKLSVVLLLVLAVGQGIGAFFFIEYTKASLEQALQQRIERLASQSAAVVAEPILNYNFPLIDSYLQEALKDQDITAIRITDAGGETLREERSEAAAQSTTVSHEIAIGTERLGSISIDYAPHTINAWTRRSWLVIPLYQLAMLLGAGAILLVLVHRYIRLPVARLNRLVAEATSGDLNVVLPRFANDDIGSIAAGVGFLIDRLAVTIARIHGLSANVSAATLQLTGSFEQVTRVVHEQQASIRQVASSVREATESQQRIAENSEELLSLAGSNASALLEMRATSEEIALGADSLSSNINNSYASLSQLTESAQQVAVMAAEVTRAIESSGASIEQMFGSLQQVEKTVRESAKLTEQTTEIVSNKGMAAVSEAVRKMAGIETFIGELNGAVSDMNERSVDIEKVLAVIGDVTDQIQLLSLNAQIIAAQAGEHGQGFAVVADEMRALSNRTAVSTREIEEIVFGIKQRIEGVVRGAREAVRATSEGRAVVDGTGEVFRETLDSARRATQLARTIESATIEQTRGLEVLVRSSEQIKDRILEVSRATEEQRQSTGYLLKNISPIKEAMQRTQSATQEQAHNAAIISGNLELTNDKSSDISSSTIEQQQVNRQILRATEGLLGLAAETASEVKGNAGVLAELNRVIGELKQEAAQFRVDVSRSEALPKNRRKEEFILLHSAASPDAHEEVGRTGSD